MPCLPRLRWFLLAAALCVASPAIRAQAVEPDSSVSAALRSLASRAGVVFAGQVLRIERKNGIVEITFRVDQTILGVTTTTYTLREWAGL
jgi:hypothetical protein